MKNIYLSVILVFIISCVYCQNENATDTLKCNIDIRYTRVEFSNAWADEAEMHVYYLPNNANVMLLFEVPNYDVRYKTTKKDFAVIKLKDKEVKLQNQVEKDANGLIQNFVLHASKDTMMELLNDGLKRITFYFAPNEDFIIKRLLNEKNLNPRYKDEISQLAKQTVQTTIWSPDKKKLQELKLWLEKL